MRARYDEMNMGAAAAAVAPPPPAAHSSSKASISSEKSARMFFSMFNTAWPSAPRSRD